MTTSKVPNRLIQSTSPYLLQHAYNPVDWFEWGNEAFLKAKLEDKPVLVSIGYSSCHWCHVMERECFEKDDIAQVMNEYFVCIKVDREERPDVDQIYMDAVQAMDIHGGWPLNVFLTADQKPFYGGTYFPPQNWVQVLTNIHKAYQSKRNEIETSAEELKKHLSRNDTERFKQKAEEQDLKQAMETIFQKLENRFDETWGGLDKAPKFIMPSMWIWLLRYYYLEKNERARNHILFTLKRIAMGGIYDQLGGGFARYSVDAEWFAPHFEKMLYDNAQLLSLYAEAFMLTQDQEFSTIIHETFDWLIREMTNEEGAFYSALDADSEGIEGKFYVWTKDELNSILGDQAQIVIDYYSIKNGGNWEHGNNILFRNRPDKVFLAEYGLNEHDWHTSLTQIKKKLLEARSKRVRPGLDDKVITSWNAMMITGLVDAYHALGDTKFLQTAIKNMAFLKKELTENNQLFRSYKGKRSIVKGFLDDYAYVIQANIKLYQATFDEHYLSTALIFTEETLQKFYEKSDGYFRYTSIDSEKLIADRREIFDNVIPSSNSVMALNLYHLSIILDRAEWKEIAVEMVTSLGHLIKTEPNYMSNWAIGYTEIKKGLAEIAIVGPEANNRRREFKKHFEPFCLVVGTETESSLPLLKGKITNGQTTLFVCHDKTCKLPVHSVSEALSQVIAN